VGFELSPLEIQTLDFVLQGKGLRGEFCQVLIREGLNAERDGMAGLERKK
jgi:hypothetical protein